MAKASRSGIVVTTQMVPLILGMVQRGDRNHDIGAWFGLNQGRIKETKSGDYGLPPAAPQNQLPPPGSTGPRALELRRDAAHIEQLLVKGNLSQALRELRRAIADFDAPR
jgi:hypothetical protein